MEHDSLDVSNSFSILPWRVESRVERLKLESIKRQQEACSNCSDDSMQDQRIRIIKKKILGDPECGTACWLDHCSGIFKLLKLSRVYRVFSRFQWDRRQNISCWYQRWKRHQKPNQWLLNQGVSQQYQYEARSPVSDWVTTFYMQLEKFILLP